MSEKTYRTAEIAAIVGIHPNTVRFYEEQGLLPPIPRKENGYRVFTKLHLLQLQFIRRSFRAEILSANLRREVIEIVKISAQGAYNSAVRQTLGYREHIKQEIQQAHEAVRITEDLIGGIVTGGDRAMMGRREAAALSGVSMDVLRDWERNGLVEIPREGSRRRYGEKEINQLKIIAVLRRANYSQMAIRRMMHKLNDGEVNLLSAIDTPEETEDIISVADHYITSLTGALGDTEEMLGLLEEMKIIDTTLH